MIYNLKIHWSKNKTNTFKDVQYIKIQKKNHEQIGECWECISHSKNGGYIQGGGKFRLVHRWIHWYYTKEIPEVVMHLCDNPSCINPSHLKSGTHKENVQDCLLKGRHNFGINKGVKNGMFGRNVSKEYGNKISKTLKKHFKQKRGENNGLE